MNSLPKEYESARGYLDSCIIPLVLKETMEWTINSDRLLYCCFALDIVHVSNF